MPISPSPVPPSLTVPLRQHIGAPAAPVVKPGDKVLKGQLIASATGMVSAPVHAPTSGTVTAIDLQPVPHPSGLYDVCISIRSDGEDRWIERTPLDWRAAEPAAIIQKIRDSGVVGLGGAAFPTHVKMSAGGQRVETLVINAAECEPWITSDDMLMRERAEDIVRGIEIIQRLLSPARVLIGIEDNKPEAIEIMGRACAGTPFEVVPVPTLYPTGGEKQLIKVLTGKDVPSGQRPINIGVVCSNVATAYALHRAVDCGEPVVSRIVTVTGNVEKPRNFEALLGTPVEDLIRLAGGARPDTDRYILGGPMMGVSIKSLRIPMVKATNCVIAASPALFPQKPAAMPCLRCTECAQACPMSLQPFELYWHSRGKNFDKAQNYDLFDCIECGCCTYVCPSGIPLVHYFRFAKSEIFARERDKNASERARQRHSLKEARLEREKQEKAARLAEKAAAARSENKAVTETATEGKQEA